VESSHRATLRGGTGETDFGGYYLLTSELMGGGDDGDGFVKKNGMEAGSQLRWGPGHSFGFHA